jgi:DNA-binding PucR family transcriptional regulator
MSSLSGWEPPSDAVADLIRTAAERMLADPQALFDEVNTAVMQTAASGLAADPALAAAVNRTNAATLVHWATANIRRPGQPVTANIGPDSMDLARDVVRRGLDDTSLAGYRVGQNVAWRYWMDMAFTLTSDVELLREMLDISSRSIASYVDATIDRVRAQIDREREQLLSGTRAQRLETVTLILDGAPITKQRASTRLGYELDRPHTAYIVWSDPGGVPQGELERTANKLAEFAGARRPFTVAASATSLWAWVSGEIEIDLAALEDALDGGTGIRVALGSKLFGIDGFRRSHQDARVTQRLMLQMTSGQRAASHREVRLVALATQNEEAAADFVTHTIGALATAEHELRDTLRIYIRERFSVSRTARVLFTHRNTILKRLARADALLPEPLAQRGLEVGLALEIVHWLGSRG